MHSSAFRYFLFSSTFQHPISVVSCIDNRFMPVFLKDVLLIYDTLTYNFGIKQYFLRVLMKVRWLDFSQNFFSRYFQINACLNDITNIVSTFLGSMDMNRLKSMHSYALMHVHTGLQHSLDMCKVFYHRMPKMEN